MELETLTGTGKNGQERANMPLSQSFPPSFSACDNTEVDFYQHAETLNHRQPKEEYYHI